MTEDKRLEKVANTLVESILTRYYIDNGTTNISGLLINKILGVLKEERNRAFKEAAEIAEEHGKDCERASKWVSKNEQLKLSERILGGTFIAEAIKRKIDG